MKKGTRNLIILAGCAVALGAATILLTKSGGGGSSASSSEASASSIQLVSKTSADVASMKVTNKKGSYTLVPVASKTASSAVPSGASSDSSSSAPGISYTVQELNGIPIDTSETSSVVQNGFSLVATKNLGTVSNTEDFGLSNPQATVVVRFKDGTTFDYKIGNATATDSSAYYMSGENSKNVYVVTIDQGLLEGQTYFVSKDILAITPAAASGASSAAADASQNDFSRISLTGSSFPQPVVLEKQGDTLGITSPGVFTADNTKLAAMESALTTLSADSVEAANPDAATLTKCGFDKPTVIADYNVNKGNYKLLIGAEKDSKYYVMVSGVNVIYNVTSDSISAVAGMNLFSLRSKLLLVPDIETVKQIDFTSGTTQNSVTVTRAEKASSAASSSSASSETQKSYAYTVAGDGAKALNYDTNYKHFYEKLIGLQLLEDNTAKPAGTPVFTVKYSYFDKSNADTLEFYQAADRRYLAVLNGVSCGNVTSTDVDAVVSQLAAFEAGKSVPDPNP